MSKPATSRVRLAVTLLDDRTVPSVTVDATTTARPFDFVATGTLSTTDPTTDGTTALTRTATNAVTVSGTLDYTDTTHGTSTAATFNGTGTGNEKPTTAGSTGGVGNFAQTVTGQLTFTDTNGAVATTAPVTGSVNWFTPSGGTGTAPIGSLAAAGKFDVSTFQLQAGWGAAGDPSTGKLNVTLANATEQATDLAFGQQTASLATDGSVTLDFAVNVSGDLMKAATETTAVSHVTAIWTGDKGQTQDAGIDIPIYWNTGSIQAHVEGLTAPTWAKGLTVQLDAGNTITEADETNNTWSVTLANLTPPTPPPAPPVDPGTPATPPADVPGAFPTPAASFALVNGSTPTVQFLNAAGQVIYQTPAFSDFTGPVSIGVGDVNGDGVPDVAIAAGSGGGPRVRVLDGRTGNTLSDFFAYNQDFRGGVNLAVGDLNGTGTAQIITGAGKGGGPRVNIFDGMTGQLLNAYFAYAPNARGGVSVTAADLNGNGRAEIVTAPGVGSGSQLRVFGGVNADQQYAVSAAPDAYTGGIQVSARMDPSTQTVLLTAARDDGPLMRFRSQLNATEPPLTPLAFDPLAV